MERYFEEYCEYPVSAFIVAAVHLCDPCLQRWESRNVVPAILWQIERLEVAATTEASAACAFAEQGSVYEGELKVVWANRPHSGSLLSEPV